MMGFAGSTYPADSYINVIASEAKQSILSAARWIASSLRSSQ
jgi:hypothetical protein